jgi:hypothetical protein
MFILLYYTCWPTGNVTSLKVLKTRENGGKISAQCTCMCTVLYLLAYWECDVTQGEVSKTREMGGKISAQCTCMCIVLYLLAHWKCDVTQGEVSKTRENQYAVYLHVYCVLYCTVPAGLLGM